MKNRSKYNVSKDNKNREYNGIVFDSELEKRYYVEVVLPKIDSGEIIICERQKKYILQPKLIKNGKSVLPIEYKADFYIKYKDNKESVIDIKGFPDQVALLKRKMFWYVYPEIDYKWIVYVKKYGGWIEYEERKALKRKEKANELKGEKGNDKEN